MIKELDQESKRIGNTRRGLINTWIAERLDSLKSLVRHLHEIGDLKPHVITVTEIRSQVARPPLFRNWFPRGSLALSEFERLC